MPTRIIVTAVVGPEILNAGDNIYVAQGGFIGSEDYHAIIPLAHNHSIIIDGTVLGHESAIASNWNSTGIRIALGETGIVSGAADPAMFLSGGNHSIVNFGQIRGALDGISMDTSMGTQSTIENHGTIQANNAAIDRANASSTEKLVIKNFGTISGGSFSFHHVDSNAIEHITNKGLMIGDVSLGLGNDLYDGRKGTIDGAIRGGGGNDKLYAGAGDDAIHGEAGNDILIGGAGRDVLNGGTGTDRASYNSANAGVTVNLSKPSLNTGDAKGDTYSSIEELAGSYFNDNLTGNSLNNWILGSDGNDTLNGSTGKDKLTGGDGNDTFVFNTTLNASTNVDTITDFNVDDDRIQIDNAVFLGLPTGTLAAAAFRANATGNAADATDRIIYETDTGKLFFDANGNAAGAKIHFATLTAGLALTNADFIVI